MEPADPDSASAHRANPYEGTLADLEKSVHVPISDQVIEQPASQSAPASGDWDEHTRQLKIAGGA